MQNVTRRPSAAATSAAIVALMSLVVGVLGASSSAHAREVRAAQPRLAAPVTAMVRDGFHAGPILQGSMVTAGDQVFFTAADKANATFTLWRTDGTASGTVALPPAAANHSNYDLGTALVALGDIVIFDVAGQAWRSDGTSAGTYQLPVQLGEGISSSIARDHAMIGDVLVFGDANSNPWRTDGTVAGTYPLVDKGPGRGPGAVRVRDFTTAGGSVYWQAQYDGVSSLWTSDGTQAGTRQVTLPFSPVQILDLAAVGSTVYLSHRAVGYDAPPSALNELWRTDGTEAGTVPVSDQFPGSELVAFAGAVHFFAPSSAGSGSVDLWRSDGTTAGTTPLAFAGSYPQQLTVSGNRLFFSSTTPSLGNELWASDGTSAGTGMVADLSPGSSSFTPIGFLPSARGIHFVSLSDEEGPTSYEGLWTSDGTATGTGRVDSLTYPTTATGPEGYTVIGDVAYLTRDSGGREAVRSVGLYRVGEATSGTSAGTEVTARVAKMVRLGAKLSVPLKLTAGANVRVKVRTTVRLGSARKKASLRTTSAQLKPGTTKTVKLTASKTNARKIKAAVAKYRAAPKAKKRKERVIVKIVVRATDTNGRVVTVRRSVTVV